MKILVIANIPPYSMGGAEIQALHLATEWAKSGHSVTVAGNRNKNDVLFVWQDIFLNVFNIKTLRKNKFTRAVSYSISLTFLVLRKKKEFDLVYCRFVKEPTIIICLLKLFKLHNLPIVSCTECTGKRGEAYFLENFFFSNLFIRLINKYNDVINIISPAIEKELISIGLDKNKFSYIPNGTPVENLPEFSYNDFLERRNIVFVGRLVKRKNIDILMHAIRCIAKTYKNISLDIIGTGPIEDELKKLREDLVLHDIVNFIGFIDENKKINTISKYKLFVLPSELEGFGIVVIEAMKAGIPVIVTNSGGPEFFIDNSVGRVAMVGDIDSLANAITELLLLDTNKLYEMGKKAQDIVKEKYDIKILSLRHIELFQQILNKKYSERQLHSN